MRNDLSKTIEAEFGIKPWQAFSIRHYLFEANPNIFMFDESGDLFQCDVDKEWHKINNRSASIIICQVMPESLLQIVNSNDNEKRTIKENQKMEAKIGIQKRTKPTFELVPFGGLFIDGNSIYLKNDTQRSEYNAVCVAVLDSELDYVGSMEYYKNDDEIDEIITNAKIVWGE